MKRFCLLLLVLFLASAAAAQVSVLSVTTEDSHTEKRDFLHTFEYYIVSGGDKSRKCQATRIAKKWFATAAHCVETCANGCTIQIDLLEQPVSALSQGKHTPKKPMVFIHPLYQPQEEHNVNWGLVKYDFALIHLDINSAPAIYYRRTPQGQPVNEIISRAEFDRYLKTHLSAQREFRAVIHPSLPPVLVFEKATRRIDRKLSVISIFDGQRSILQNPYPTYYVQELGFAYTNNFGVRKGMSGSGVMTNTGELAGVIAAGYTAENKKEKHEYFMFPVFNKDLTDFMESVMGSDYDKVDFKDAEPNYVAKTRVQHPALIQHLLSNKKKTSKK